MTQVKADTTSNVAPRYSRARNIRSENRPLHTSAQLNALRGCTGVSRTGVGSATDGLAALGGSGTSGGADGVATAGRSTACRLAICSLMVVLVAADTAPVLTTDARKVVK